jgi:hypothetical protein
MDSSLKKLQEEMTRLVSGFAALEARVASLEGALLPPEAEPVSPEVSQDGLVAPSLADWPRRIAVVSFALGGALVLRVATQQNLLDPTAGTWLGLAYAALLVATPLLPGQFGRRYPLLPYCGALLPMLIVLESVLRFDQLAPGMAAAALHGTALLGAFSAVRARLGRLAGIALATAITASLGLVGRPDAMVWCAYGVLLEVVAAHELVRRRHWTVLRPLVLVPAMLLLGVALLYASQRPAYAGVTPHLVVAVAGTWAVVFAAHLGWLKRQRVATAGWLPVVSVWAVALSMYAAPARVPYAAGALAILVAATALRAAFRGHTAGVAGLVSASSFLAAGAALGLPGRAVVLALWSLLASWFARRLVVAPLAVLAASLVLAATALFLVDAGMVTNRPEMSLEVLPGLLVASLLLTHYVLFRGQPETETVPPASGVLAPVSLLGGVVLCFFLCRLLLGRLAPADAHYQLLQTGLLGLFAAAALLLARWPRSRLPNWVGILGLVLLVLKVVLMDLFTLQGIPLLLSVVTLGAASALASLTLRTRV